MENAVTIIGAEQNTACECCNRKLKVGIRTNMMGAIGADCFRAAMISNRKRFSQGKPDASFLRELAIIKETRNAAWIARSRYDHVNAFSFEVA